MKFLGLCIAFAGSTILHAQTIRPPSIATVKLLVVDCYGKAINKLDRFSFKDSKGRDQKELFDQNLIARVPVGVYKLQISVLAPFEMQFFEASVVVRVPETSFVAGLDFYYPEDGLLTWDVRGRFEVPLASEEMCTLSGLYVPHRYFTRVQREGEFTFANVRAGAYTLACGLDSISAPLRIVKVPSSPDGEEVLIRN